MVGEDEVGHGFDHGDGAGEDAGVVAAAGGEGGFFAGVVDGVLFDEDGGGGFEGNAEDDGFAIADAALDAATAVGAGADFAVLDEELVVVVAPGHEGAFEAGADFEAFGGGETHHGFGEIGFEFVEDGFAEAGGDAADDALDDAADGVAFGAHLGDEIDHGVDHGGVGGADDVGFDLLGGDGIGVDVSFEVVDGLDVGDALVAGEVAQENFAGDGAGGDAADGFAGGGAAATGDGADAVFGVVGVVGVGRAVGGLHLRVGGGALVGVADEDADGGAGGEAVFDAAEDFGFVSFFAGSDDFALAGATAVEFFLEVLDREGDFRGAAVNDDTNTGTVGFSPSGNAKERA